MTGREHLAYDRDRVRVIREPWLGRSALSYAGDRPRDVLDVLDIAVHHRPDAVAVVDAVGGATRTVQQLCDDVAATADYWRQAGLRPGHGVGIAAGNSGDHLVALLAAATVGAVAVGLSSRLAAPQWRFQLQHSRCTMLLYDDGHAAAASSVADGVDGPLRPLGSAVIRGTPGGWQEVAAGRAPAEPTTAYQVVHTSGSTGEPKASQVVHRASVHSGIAYDRLLRLRPGESTGVLFHLGYISAMHAHVIPALLSGARLVMLPTGSPRTWVEQLAAFDVAWAYAVPSWWLLALREPGLRAAALPQLRLAGAGGSPYPDLLREGLAKRLPDTELLNIYGLSETHSPATVLRGADLWRHAGAAGQPLEVVEVSVRDEHGAPVADGEAGEVWLGGSLVTTGYARDPDGTAAAVVGGMLRTGDVGRLEQGPDKPSTSGPPAPPVLRLLDRVKDTVDRAGTKVWSVQVERALTEHPAIVEAACVAAPDTRSGETVAVFLVLDEAHQRPADGELRRWVRERLGDAAAPSILRWVGELPKGGTGKTDKLALRAVLAGPHQT